MSFTIFNLINKSINTSSRKGKKGEKALERKLEVLQRHGYPGLILKNVYIPKGNGQTTEIDAIFITSKGIFVFESKNYSGKISGKEDEKYWNVKYPGKRTEKMYNPIWQNGTHIKWLRKYLGDKIPYYSIVVFSDNCKLRIKVKDAIVRKTGSLPSVIRKIWSGAEDAAEQTEISRIYNLLQICAEVDREVKKEHIRDVSNHKKWCVI